MRPVRQQDCSTHQQVTIISSRILARMGVEKCQLPYLMASHTQQIQARWQFRSFLERMPARRKPTTSLELLLLVCDRLINDYDPILVTADRSLEILPLPATWGRARW